MKLCDVRGHHWSSFYDVISPENHQQYHVSSHYQHPRRNSATLLVKNNQYSSLLSTAVIAVAGTWRLMYILHGGETYRSQLLILQHFVEFLYYTFMTAIVTLRQLTFELSVASS